MPWIAKRLENQTKPRQSRIETAITGLQQARAEAQTQAGWVEDLIFDDWIARCVIEANDPREWTQARVLYEDYLTHAKTCAKNRAQKTLVVQVLATETQWGRMMATLFPKKRRTAGWYYPLRCKRGG